MQLALAASALLPPARLRRGVTSLSQGPGGMDFDKDSYVIFLECSTGFWEMVCNSSMQAACAADDGGLRMGVHYTVVCNVRGSNLIYSHSASTTID